MPAKKTASKTPAVKKPAAKKTVAKKAVAKKTTSATARGKKGASSSFLYLDRDNYNACIDGLMAQGLDREDAVATLKVGLRQANGRPVPSELLGDNSMAPSIENAPVEEAEALAA